MSWSAAPDRTPASSDSIGVAEPMPPGAAAVFGAELHTAARYADLLVGAGAVHGVIGPREAPRIWTRHVLQSAVIERVVPTGVAVADLGSGAGLPGIPLAVARPDLRVVLVEPLARRTRFLAEALTSLSIENAEVVQERAEAHAKAAPRRYGAVVARAVTDLATLYRWARPMLRSAGVLVAVKGARAADELASSAADLRGLGGVAEVRELGHDVLPEPVTVVLVREGRR